MNRSCTLGAVLSAAILATWLATASNGEEKVAAEPTAASGGRDGTAVDRVVKTVREGDEESPAIASFVLEGVDWLVAAQQKDGGWGGGAHAKQNIRDPHAVRTDPATTAFTALALLRAGHTPVAGSHQQSVRRATEYLVKAVEDAPVEGPKITDITGTQPQSKLGPLVDTSMTAQLLARVLPTLKEAGNLHRRVDKALEKCLAKLEASQAADGSWKVGGRGWAPVLQSSLNCSALELARVAGKQVDAAKLDKAREYQKANISAATGRAKSGDAAGVELYSFATAQRAAAGEARAASDRIEGAKRSGRLAPDSDVSEENLRVAGVSGPQARKLAEASDQIRAQKVRQFDENMLRGFGNNGGEEFLSYLLTSESLVILGDEQWAKWNDKMHGRLQKIQNKDGSWSGHHCITSHVFCTAAVVQCLTADRDAEMLLAIARTAEKESKVASGK